AGDGLRADRRATRRAPRGGACVNPPFDGAWCLVSREYPPHSGGGIGTYAKTFARLLADRGIPVVVLTAHAGPRAEDDDSGITVIRLPLNADDRWASPHPSIDTADMTSLWRTLGPHSVFSKQIGDLVPELLDRFGVRVIEGCDTGAPLWHLLDDRSQAKWSAEVRVITHVHSPSAWIEWLNRRLEQSTTMHELQRMEREQTRASDAVVTPSFGMQRWLAEHWGVHADVIRYPFDACDASTPSEGGVLFVGRLEYRKGIDTLLRAWPRVDTDATLTIAGRDVIDYRTGSAIGEGMLAGLDRVNALGPQPPERVTQLQADASVVAVPSPDDNFPFTCIEAMAAGRVVVAANRGGAAEMIEDGVSGLLFEPYDERSLSAAIERALHVDGDERHAMETAARMRISTLCDAQRVISERLSHASARNSALILNDHRESGTPIELRTAAEPTNPPPRPLWKRLLRHISNR
ncbi:MAG: glycosyltransferase family 4 protein, partial [Planctomycetota bacterium]